jgi:predicted SAM-dependent methyltransferase
MKSRLNLGCGADIRPEYLNVDMHSYDGVDIVADVATVKFPNESFTEILAKDIIEHLTFIDAKALLRKCFGWLQKGGNIVIHVQNMPYLAQQLSNDGDYDDPFHFEVLKWIYGVSAVGDSKSPGRFHHWGYSDKSLSKILQKIGFKVVKTQVDCEGFGLLVVAYKETA